MKFSTESTATQTDTRTCPSWCSEDDAPEGSDSVVHNATVGAGVSISIATGEDAATIFSRQTDFTPSKAREVAAALVKAADIAEGSA